MLRWISMLGLSAGLLAGCLGIDGFACQEDSECVLGQEMGRCEATGWCSFSDEDCGSGSRYGKHAGNGLGDTCVGGDGDSTGEETGSESGSGSSTGDSSSSSDGPDGSSTGDECADLGASCEGDEDCCTDCMACEEGICTARTGDAAPCGQECLACSSLGECEIAVGADCGMETLNCADYVWGEENAQCYALAPNEVGGKCDDLGQCGAPNATDCPIEQGDVLLGCGLACLDPNHTCSQGALSANITLASLCVLNQKTAGCDKSCSDGSGSTEYDKWCDNEGKCANLSWEDCGAYRCDGDHCGTSCNDNGDCVWFHTCVNGECVQG